MKFRTMRGSLFTGNRLESGFALIALMINRAVGGKAEQRDFMPHAEPAETTLEDIAREFGGFKRG